MTRQIVLDTETTGLEALKGDRVVELGCVELIERRPTGRVFHEFFNPDRRSDPGALEKHGIRDEFLLDKPRFPERAQAFVDFVCGAEIIIHNAAFDVAFLDMELDRAGHEFRCSNGQCAILDTLGLARRQWPGQRNSLDALCRRLGVDSSMRELHGALLDARLLADVYLAMTAGQGDLALVEVTVRGSGARARDSAGLLESLRRFVPEASDLAAHDARLQRIAARAAECRAWPLPPVIDESDRTH